MSFPELAAKRYSVRKFRSETVSRELIDQCLESARLAPSACNSQPWSFYVADSPAICERLGAAAFSGIYSMNSFARKAPVLIAVVTERSGYAARLGGTMRGVQFSLIDIGIACDHLTLCAAELGLGSCWLGWFNERAVVRELGLPAKTHIDTMLALGYPETPPPERKNRRTLEEIRSYVS